MTRWVALSLGFLAIIALCGVLDVLPPYVSFFTGSLSIILFTGAAAAGLAGLRYTHFRTIPEQLGVWFTVGAAVLATLGFIGILLHLRLSHIALVLILSFASILCLSITKRIGLGIVRARDRSHRLPGWRISAIVLALAVGTAFLTISTPRDDDDWYYLAYINDYVADHPLGLEDAFFDAGQPASPRAWFGGWWVVEALLTKAAGADPVDSHQVYFPLLIVPFAVLAVYTLARTIIRPYASALLACCFQVLYYVSSAFPTKSAGWVFLCRTAQDKTIPALVMIPVMAALWIGYLRDLDSEPSRNSKAMYALFLVTLVGSALVHPYGPLWCGLAVGPFMLIELLLKRTRRLALASVMMILPFLICGLFLVYGHRLLQESYEVLQQPRILPWEEEEFVSVYLPGTPFPPKAPPPGRDIRERVEPFRMVKLSYVLNYPLAAAGVVFTLLLIPRARSSLAARFLICTTFSVAVLAFTPLAAEITAKIMTYRMAHRITWIFPWGLTIGVFLSTLKARSFWKWMLLIAVFLGLARANPGNYLKSLAAVKSEGRPPREAAAALGFLRSRPAPQGGVLASENTGKFLAAFVPDAYPAAYRGAGPLWESEVEKLLDTHQPDMSFIFAMLRTQARYLLIEKGLPLAKALNRGWTNLDPIYENRLYQVWEVPDYVALAAPRRSKANVVLLTIDALRPDHLGCYGYRQPTTPNIDRFAARGIRFDTVICQSPQTVPSTASILTGLHPRTHKALNDASTLGSRFSTLAEILSEEDFLKAAFVSSRFVDRSCGLDRGFDVYWDLHDAHPTIPALRFYYEREEDSTTDTAAEWLRKYRANTFFLWVNWSHPRRPYRPPPRYRRYIAGISDEVAARKRVLLEQTWTQRENLTGEDVAQLVALYDAEIAFADAQVGRIIDELESLDLLQHTIVIITAPHGEMLYDHGRYFGHDTELYDATIRVPLIAYLPRSQLSPSKVEEQVSTIDILPTVLDLLEIEHPEPTDGRSLIGLIAGGSGGETETTGYAFAETFPFPDQGPPRHAVRTQDFKLIWKETPIGEIGREFYNLSRDPGETTNMYRPDNATAADLDSVLAGWLEDDGLHPAPIPPQRNDGPWRFLRRFGYVE